VASVFLSYARADTGAVDALEHELRQLKVQIWRDQKNLYSGQRWPKALGEAIAAADALVLMWSSQAAQSEFVELEWTTALALRKPLLPCLLDQTPLPAALRAIHAITLTQLDRVAQEIEAALRTAKPSNEVAQNDAVLSDLAKIEAQDAKVALKLARAVFVQHGLNVQGTVYQAGGDIHINAPATSAATKPWPERWQVWVAIVVGILTAITLARGLLTNSTAKVTASVETQAAKATEQVLAGFVRGEKNEPLEEVTLSLPAFKLSQTTDQNGYFHFVIKVSEQQTVVLLANKKGYGTYETYATLGNPNMNFALRRQK
jgi:hypothetical protein